MSAKTIAEMQEELEKAGIDWCVRYLEWEPISEPQKEIAITENYKRYQRERQHEAMRGLLEELAKEADEYSLWLFGRYPETVSSSSALDIEIGITTIQKAKALLAKIAESESMKTELK